MSTIQQPPKPPALSQLQYDVIMSNFRTPRYDHLNKLRWDAFLGMEIPLADKVIFEPGAGIGDQTQWLLEQGVRHIYVNEGRPDNMQIIQERFAGNPRLSFLVGNMEECLGTSAFRISVDLTFMWGMYYHINDHDFHIMRGLAILGQTVVFEYLESPTNWTETYGYDNPSTSISHLGIRHATPPLMKALKLAFGNAYLPKNQLDWEDPLSADTPRRLAVGSRIPIDSSLLVAQ